MKQTDFAVSTNVFARNTLDFALETLGDAGFNRLQLWGHVSQFHPGYLTQTQAERLAGRVRGAGFEIVSFFPEGGAYPLNPASPDEDLRGYTVRYYKHAIDLGCAMGIGQMTFHPGYGLRDRPLREAIGAASRTWRTLGRYAMRRGIAVSLLNCTAVHLGSLEQLGALINEVGNITIALDVSLAARCPDALRALLKENGRIHTVHLSDGPLSHLAFGDGVLPMEEICRGIADAGYLDRTVITLDNRRYVLLPGAAVRQTAERIGAWM